VVIVLCALSPALTTGYGWGKDWHAFSQVNDNEGGPANISALTKDPGNELRNAFRKLKTAYPYRLTDSRTYSENGQISSSETSVTEYAAADRIRMKSSDKDGKSSEMIIIGNINYFYVEGKWTEEAISADEKANLENGRDKFLSSLSDVQFAGLQTVNGVKCKTYSYRWGLDISVSGKFPEGSGKAWIGVADGLPHQMDSDLEIHGHRTKSHSVYEYNVDIKIDKPKV
jgi:hypothetical protein